MNASSGITETPLGIETVLILVFSANTPFPSSLTVCPFMDSGISTYDSVPVYFVIFAVYRVISSYSQLPEVLAAEAEIVFVGMSFFSGDESVEITAVDSSENAITDATIFFVLFL